jgi:hypothetical protein
VGGWMDVGRRCWLYGVSVTGWGGSTVNGVLGSAAATLPDVAHGATREHSEGGQCEQSCSEPCVHEGAANGPESCSAWAEELEGAEEWRAQ